jgi:uncharacterized lipoprotein YddW (UPF0748 family)
MRKYLLPFLACISIIYPDSSTILAQTTLPKREFRGAWIATVTNIDFPSSPGLSQERFTEEWSKTLDLLSSANFNAVLAQVRPAGDAFYRSKISPWSKYLTGKAGHEPSFDFDPLEYMVQDAHAQNLEFHAWLNPYRASMDTITEKLPANHPFKMHPEWFVRYGGKLYFNPALPEVRNYITEIVMEIVLDYKVDGIHFDDYFYPYPAGGEAFPDAADFSIYGYGFYTIDDWRRSNVDKLISQVSHAIRTYAPGVKFGISPFGVWRNQSKDPQLGSATRAGVNCYDDLFADIRGWLEKGWIDYVAPQLYWHIGFAVADYETLIHWWKKNAFDRHVYVGHAAYKVNNNPENAWKNGGEIPRQIRLNRSVPGIGGSIYYNTSSLRKNPLGLLDSLRSRYYTTPALLPEMTFMNLPQPLAPTLGNPKIKDGTLFLPCSMPAVQEGVPTKLVVYRFEDRLPGDYQNPENIHQLIYLGDYPYGGLHKQEKKFRLFKKPKKDYHMMIEDKNVENGKTYTYAVSVLNRACTESNLSNYKAVSISKNKIRKIKT